MALRYPVLMVHGMGFRDDLPVGYWGRIPGTLEAMGCRLFYGNQDSNADIDTNGAHLAARIDVILAETGAEKVNILAHSKGGLDARHAITALGMGSKVASLTTVSTPHHGSKTVDLLMKFPDPLVRFVGFCADCWIRVLGDKRPNSYRVFHTFTTKDAADFNARTPDHPQVYYQSYAFVMGNPFSDMLMWVPSLVVGWLEGENDGLLTPDAVKWGNFRGIIRSGSRRGISHLDEIDLRRRPLRRPPAQGVYDVTQVYTQIIRELEEMGF